MSVAAISNKGSANGEGIELVDINPSKSENGYRPVDVDYQMAGEVMLGYGNYAASGGSPKGLVSFLPVQGYEAISIKKVSSDGTLNVCFADSSGNLTTAVEVGNTTWTDLEIPSSAVNLVFYSQESSVSTHRVWYSLKSRKKVTPRVVADDINPYKELTPNYQIYMYIQTSSSTPVVVSSLPCKGFSKVHLYTSKASLYNAKFAFLDASGNVIGSWIALEAVKTWQEADVPSGAESVALYAYHTSTGNAMYFYYSMEV